MEYEYFMPARVLGGREAVRRNAALLSRFGKSCLLVTGRRSALASGAQQDIAAALESQGIRWQVFAQIGENPYLEDCRRAAEQCRACGAEFVVGIGGGSPMDAARRWRCWLPTRAFPRRIFTPETARTAPFPLCWWAPPAAPAAR